MKIFEFSTPQNIVGSVWGFQKFSSSFLGGVLLLYLFLRSVQLLNAWLLKKL